jgi:hypothetical protein
MAESNISEKAFAQIQEEGIKPSSEMKFHFQRSLFWVSAFLALIVGALAVAVTLYVIADNDWDMLGQRGLGWKGSVIYALPYFWLVVLGGFLLIAHYTFRHTKFGYRYRLWQVVVANIVLAIFVGAIFYACGFGANLDYVLAKTVPGYKEVNNPRIKVWSQPQAGFLAGEIIEPGLEFIVLEDLQNRQWRVNIVQAKLKPRVNFIDGERIKIIGKIENERNFLAQEVRPWFGRQLLWEAKIEMKEKINR